MKKIHPREKGQSLVTFVAAFPILIFALTVVFDFGLFLITKSYTRMIADSAALAGAGALDMSGLDQQIFILNPDWADARVRQAYNQNVGNMSDEDSMMTFTLTNVSVSGASVWVSVSGRCNFVWGSYMGLVNCSTTATSSARAASGISSELGP